MSKPGDKPTKTDISEFVDKYNKEFPKSKLDLKAAEAVIDLVFDKKFLFGRDRIFKYMMNNEPYKSLDISRRQVMAILRGLTVSQLFHGKRDRTTDIKKDIQKAPMVRIQMDLLDQSMIEHDGYNFTMTAIDTFSKYAVAVPMKGKDEEEVIRAMKIMLDDFKRASGVYPRSILSDNGSEFVNKKTEALLKEKGIKHIFSKAGTPTSHANVESFNRILRQLIAKYKLQFDDADWVSALPTLMENYNKTMNRNTGKAPIKILDESEQENVETREKIIKRTVPKNDNEQKLKLKEGDFVRLKLENDGSKKSLEINWSKEVYVITKIFRNRSRTNLQPTFQIRNVEDKDPINERFYKDDLLKIPDYIIRDIDEPQRWEVSKILRPTIKKTPEGKWDQFYEIKFKGYPEIYFQLRTVLQGDIPKMLKQFETKQQVEWDGVKNVKWIDVKTKKRKTQNQPKK